MKLRTRAGGRNLFLLELVISILFFSLASAVCVQIFAESYVRSEDAKQLGRASASASAVAETVMCADSEEELRRLLEEIYPEGQFCEGPDGFSLTGEDSGLTLRTEVRRTDWMLTAEIFLEDGAGEQVYRLAVSHHLQRGNRNE